MIENLILPLIWGRTNILRVKSVQLLSCVQLFASPRAAARQASLSITNSWSLLKLMSIKSVMPSIHLILCRPLLPPSIFPSIKVFSNESVLHIRWPKYWSFSFSISPSNSGLIPLGLTGWISLQSKGLSRVFSTPQFNSSDSPQIRKELGLEVASLQLHFPNTSYFWAGRNRFILFKSVFCFFFNRRLESSNLILCTLVLTYGRWSGQTSQPVKMFTFLWLSPFAVRPKLSQHC